MIRVRIGRESIRRARRSNHEIREWTWTDGKKLPEVGAKFARLRPGTQFLRQ